MHTTRIRPLLGTVAAAALAVGGVLAGAPAANAAGVSGPAFWVDGEQYRTVGTTTDFSGTGAPASSFQPIYAFPEDTQANVATAAPGDPGYRGGRWVVTEVLLPNGYGAALASGDLDDDGVLDSDEELWAAAAAGDLAIGGVLRYFECPVIPLPRNGG
ncbi:hypothetical protein [Agromyces bracchium]|uniref:EF-hand domain-containing protein n=1 Tax=Agromyces bracchium TaxID=88376 RepID=A0A6I3MJK6_9MICO|nr:hypothetical protein [Agromyces bracchium]MTH70423.1 hypothetical protein [Agromyces bracchium]